MKKIKSIILILALFVGIQCLTVKKARAIDCSVKYNSGFFTQTEVRIALSDITNLLFQATIAFLGKDTNRISERCHLEIGVAIFPDMTPPFSIISPQKTLVQPPPSPFS